MGAVVPPHERSRVARRGGRGGGEGDLPTEAVPQLRIVFRAGGEEAEVWCVHVAVYAGPLESLPPDAELARSSERRQVKLAPEEHFFALNSYVAGIAEVGLEAMFAAAREAGNLPVGFNSLMQQQVLRALLCVAPAATVNICLWVLDDATQVGGDSHRDTGFLAAMKKVIAQNEHAPVELLARLAGDDNGNVRQAVAEHERTLPESLTHLAKDRFMSVRRAVAKHINTPPAILALLAVDEDMHVRQVVARNRNSSPETLARLAGDPNLDVQWAVANHVNTPPETLARLVMDKKLRRVVASNEHTPRKPSHVSRGTRIGV